MTLNEFLETLSDNERKKFLSNSEWWKDRQAEEQNKVNSLGVKATERQLKDYYQKAAYRIRKDFEAVYNQLLIDTAFNGVQPTPADLYKLDSYWQMQAQLAKELEKLGDYQARLFSREFMNQYKNAYKAALPSGSAFSMVNTETAKQMINSIWCSDGKNWSQRIWTNNEKLKQSLNDGLMDCVITGKPTSVLKERLQHEFGVAYNRADTIVRTEYTRIQAEAALQRYKDAGIKEVQVWADKDERRCEICGKLHEKKFPIFGEVPTIPVHPRCRCRLIPVVEID